MAVDKLGDGPERDARTRMLAAWLAGGHDLGNHTWSHADINAVPFDEFTADIVRGEDVTARLRGARPVYFRHPFLHAGADSAAKLGLERFLEGRAIASPVAMDNEDWTFAEAYDHALDARDTALARRIADAYIAYTDTVLGYYEAQARTIVGREPPQVMPWECLLFQVTSRGPALRRTRAQASLQLRVVSGAGSALNGAASVVAAAAGSVPAEQGAARAVPVPDSGRACHRAS